MQKNSLFIISIGLLIIMFSGSSIVGKNDWLSMTTGIFLVVVGSVLFFRKKKNTKKDKM